MGAALTLGIGLVGFAALMGWVAREARRPIEPLDPSAEKARRAKRLGVREIQRYRGPAMIHEPLRQFPGPDERYWREH